MAIFQHIMFNHKRMVQKIEILTRLYLQV